MLTGALAAGNAEFKMEINAFELLVSKTVPLHLAEAVHRLGSHCELYYGSHLPQAVEGKCELVVDKEPCIGVQVPLVDGQLF